MLALMAFINFAAVQPAWDQTTVSFTTAGSHTWTAPAGVTRITVEVWGGGGAGGTASGSGSVGGVGGGGGGAYARSTITVTPGLTYNLYVGVAGTSSPAVNGGDSWFGDASTLMAKGGTTRTSNQASGAQGGQASSSIGNEVTFNGGWGEGSGQMSGSPYNGGGGGSSAGTAAQGNYTSQQVNATGATAPAGGGNGGNGKTGSDGNGVAGTAPGGAGGGARKTGGSTTG